MQAIQGIHIISAVDNATDVNDATDRVKHKKHNIRFISCYTVVSWEYAQSGVNIVLMKYILSFKFGNGPRKLGTPSGRKIANDSRQKYFGASPAILPSYLHIILSSYYKTFSVRHAGMHEDMRNRASNTRNKMKSRKETKRYDMMFLVFVICEKHATFFPISNNWNI